MRPSARAASTRAAIPMRLPPFRQTSLREAASARHGALTPGSCSASCSWEWWAPYRADGVLREQALESEVQEVMRIRHGLRLDQPDDFDLVTQDAILKVWDSISQATFLALVVLSSIALMVGGIGVMSIMTMSVTERTREIGVRKALGARRIEILWQFLIEAVFLTSARHSWFIGTWLAALHRRRSSTSGRRAFSHLAALVVVCHRHRLLGQRRRLLRHGAGCQGVTARPHRGAPVRINRLSMADV